MSVSACAQDGDSYLDAACLHLHTDKISGDATTNDRDELGFEGLHVKCVDGTGDAHHKDNGVVLLRFD